ncbi:MAG: hypothetical protein U9Q80_09250 [Bacillota bacterium]|nr:hypothetical protein [Bacillota bacterium]
MPVIRKDDMFDILLNNKINRELANNISYDIMVSTIQKHIYANSDVIVDIGLLHTPSFKMFLYKFNFGGVRTKFVLVGLEQNLFCVVVKIKKYGIKGLKIE